MHELNGQQMSHNPQESKPRRPITVWITQGLLALFIGGYLYDTLFENVGFSELKTASLSLVEFQLMKFLICVSMVCLFLGLVGRRPWVRTGTIFFACMLFLGSLTSIIVMFSYSAVGLPLKYTMALICILPTGFYLAHLLRSEDFKAFFYGSRM